MFAKAVGYDHPFSNLLRIKLIMDIINNDEVRNVVTAGNTAAYVLGICVFSDQTATTEQYLITF
jgi:4-aminobutyrate aminotransferase-like enzyme